MNYIRKGIIAKINVPLYIYMEICIVHIYKLIMSHNYKLVMNADTLSISHLSFEIKTLAFKSLRAIRSLCKRITGKKKWWELTSFIPDNDVALKMQECILFLLSWSLQNMLCHLEYFPDDRSMCCQDGKIGPCWSMFALKILYWCW